MDECHNWHTKTTIPYKIVILLEKMSYEYYTFTLLP